jgi:hypothetical protein
MAKKRKITRKRVRREKGFGILFILLLFGLFLFYTHSFTVVFSLIFSLLFLIIIAKLTWKTLRKNGFKSKYKKKFKVPEMTLCINKLLSFQRHILNAKEKHDKKLQLGHYDNLMASMGKGYVYFVKECGSGTIKIGKAVDPYDRILNGFGVKFPYRLELIHLIKTENDYLTETLFHQKFHQKRINGEWFNLGKQDIKWIQRGNYSLDIFQSITKK